MLNIFKRGEGLKNLFCFGNSTQQLKKLCTLDNSTATNQLKYIKKEGMDLKILKYIQKRGGAWKILKYIQSSPCWFGSAPQPCPWCWGCQEHCYISQEHCYNFKECCYIPHEGQCHGICETWVQFYTLFPFFVPGRLQPYE